MILALKRLFLSPPWVQSFWGIIKLWDFPGKGRVEILFKNPHTKTTTKTQMQEQHQEQTSFVQVKMTVFSSGKQPAS
jgi:hypothetical protein